MRPGRQHPIGAVEPNAEMVGRLSHCTKLHAPSFMVVARRESGLCGNHGQRGDSMPQHVRSSEQSGFHFGNGPGSTAVFIPGALCLLRGHQVRLDTLSRCRRLMAGIAQCALGWCIVSALAMAAPGTVVQYDYDAAGNIIAIQRSSTALALASFSPAMGPEGATVILSGTGFSLSPTANAVTFNGVPAAISAATRTQLAVLVPSGATSGPITVTASNATVTSATSFTVTSGYGVPTITGFAPSCAAPGTNVSVSGSNFNPAANATTASLGSVAVSPAVPASNNLAFSVPGGTGSGHITIATAAGTATSAAALLVPPSGLTCTDFTPATSSLAPGAGTFLAIPGGRKGAILFDGAAGAWLSFQASGVTTVPSNAALNYVVYGAGNSTLASGTVAGPAFSVHVPPLPASGTYVLALTPAGGAVARSESVV